MADVPMQIVNTMSQRGRVAFPVWIFGKPDDIEVLMSGCIAGFADF